LPGTTLLDLERLVDRNDDSFRRWAINHTKDESARHFWNQTFEAYPRDAPLSLLNRLSRVLRPRYVRTLLCSSPTSLDVRQVMDQGRILFFVASDGLIGEDNADLLGQLFVAQVQQATMSRANVAAPERRFFTLFCDEFQRFVRASTSYEQLLSRARKYGCALVIGHQEMGQIPEPLMRSILGNVGTVVAFQVGATDARRLSRELVGHAGGQFFAVDPEELVTLRIGEAVCRVGGSVFRLDTPPPPTGGSARTRRAVVARSRRQFGSVVRPKEQAHGGPALDPGEVF
jgi:hypothetical protein